MHGSVDKGISTVLPFPKRGRFSNDRSAPGVLNVTRPIIVESGAGWYHKEAIRDAETKGKV